MATTGKSRRPPPLRDPRIESNAAIPAQDDVRRSSSGAMRAVSEARGAVEGTGPASVPSQADVERLKAERASDADDLAKMLVRVAATERARDVAERRATGLEAWTVDLEAKVAEARTRADELEDASVAMREELESARRALDGANHWISKLEGEIATVRRDAEDALEVERVKRGLEIDALQGLRAGAPAADSRIREMRERTERVFSALDKMMKLESHTSASRMRLVEQARRALGSEQPPAPSPAERVTVPPPGLTPTSNAPPSLGRPGKKRSKQPPPLVVRETSKPELELETFEDLDLGD